MTKRKTLSTNMISRVGCPFFIYFAPDCLRKSLSTVVQVQGLRRFVLGADAAISHPAHGEPTDARRAK